MKAQVVRWIGCVLAKDNNRSIVGWFFPNWGFPDNDGVHGLNVYFLIVIFISLEP